MSACQAQYGVLVFAPGLIDGPESDLAIAAILHLAQELNRVNRWSALPVAGGDGLTGASQAMLWQTGLPLRSRFTSAGPQFAPRRVATSRVLAERETDLLIWISAFLTLWSMVVYLRAAWATGAINEEVDK